MISILAAIRHEASSSNWIAFHDLRYGDIAVSEFSCQVAEFANSIPEGSVVAVLCNNDYEVPVAIFGTSEGKAVSLLLDGATTPGQLETYVRAYQVEFVFLKKGDSDKYLSTSTGKLILEFGNYALIRTDQPIGATLNLDVMMLLTTSGSTGSPKCVRITNRNLESNAAGIAARLALSSNDVAMTTLPMNYSYGLSVITSHLAARSKIVLNSRAITDRAFWRRLESSGASILAGVPFTYKTLQRFGNDVFKGTGLTKITQAGGKLDAALVSHFLDLAERQHMQFFVMYGQTEATARMSIMPPKLLREHPESVGVPLPEGQFSIEPSATEVYANGHQTGEIVYSGPNVSLGYATHRKDLEASDNFGGILRTGDLGYLDGSGLLYIVGRLKRIAKVFGHRVSLDEIEEKVSRLGYSVACVAGDDDVKILLEGIHRPETLRSVREALSQLLCLAQSGFRVEMVRELPRTPSGKIDYPSLSVS